MNKETVNKKLIEMKMRDFLTYEKMKQMNRETLEEYCVYKYNFVGKEKKEDGILLGIILTLIAFAIGNFLGVLFS